MSNPRLNPKQRRPVSSGSTAVERAAAEDRSANTLKGYLRKKSSKGTWQRRWFEASAHYLTYYKTAESDKILACIDLARVGEIKLININPGVGPYEFSIELDQRVYLMKAKTLTDAKRWVNGLNEIQERCRPHRRRPRSAGAGGGKAGSARPATMSVDSSKATNVEKPGERAKTKSCCCF